MRVFICISSLLVTLDLAGYVCGSEAPSRFRSHAAMRPLPVVAQRPMEPGPTHFVDAARGNDASDGSKANPWKTLARGAKALQPGDTLYLRGGTYYEHVTISAQGTAEKPITIRSYPGELAILDGGLREFFETPDRAWEPCPGGAEGEFRSVRTYPDLEGGAAQTNALGHFGDSMVPLHGYKYLGDLRSTNIYWNLKSNVGPESFIYCGPGVHYDVATGRIHVRLAHTNMKYLPPEDNYQGETDPRKLPLVIAGHKGGSTLTLQGARHLRVQDLVVRGSRAATVSVLEAFNIEFDGLTVYAGAAAFLVRETAGLRIVHTACRGIAAPWTFRGSLKYRALEARIFSASGWAPTARINRDFELAYSEFTDSVDGVFIGNVQGVKFHHNLLDNVTDDGIFLTAGTAYDGTTPGGNVDIYQNLLARCLTTFAFGVGHGRQKATAAGLQTGAGVRIYRNVFDFRRPLLYHQPGGPNVLQEVTSKGRVAGDHGSPAWEPMDIYHNTILADDVPRYTYGTWGLANGMGRGGKRRIFNNIIVQTHNMPGTDFPKVPDDFQADANLHWSVSHGPAVKGDPFTKFRASKAFAASQVRYPPGWGAADRFADPKFVRFGADWKVPLDLSLQPDSPALAAGIILADAWPDPVRHSGKEKPDLGALPFGAAPWHVGVGGRLTMFGQDKAPADRPVLAAPRWSPVPTEAAGPARRAAIVEGYPARDVPLVEYALRRQHVRVDVLKHAWLEPRDYAKYEMVAVIGNLVRAKIEPNKYDPDGLLHVDAFLKNGGTLVLMISGRDVLRTSPGQKYLQELTGIGPVVKTKTANLQVRAPDHPWLKHLDPKAAQLWLARAVPAEHLLRASKGEQLIGSPDGATILYRQRVGKGQLIYVGWEIHASLPATRSQVPTLEAERAFADQMQMLVRIFTP